MKKILVILFFLLIQLPCFSQETLTITTYYPSPAGSYNTLTTKELYLNEGNDGLISFNYPDINYDRRLRITAGETDTGNNDEGASIDLHGNNHVSNPGRLDLVAGEGGDITFWSSPLGESAYERMRITSDDGYVGIWTTNPQHTLDIVSHCIGMSCWSASARVKAGFAGSDAEFIAEVMADGASSAYNLMRLGGGVTLPILWSIRVPPNSTNLGFYNNFVPAGDKIVFTATGNVGIGTTSPTEKLDVVGDSIKLTAAAVGKIYINGNTVQTRLQADSGAGEGIIGTFSNHPLGIWTNTVERMTISNTGNVGIGTTNPNDKLSVNGTVSATTLQLYDTVPTIGFGTSALGEHGFMQYYDNSIDIVAKAGKDIRFGTNNTYDKVIIDINGNVGIGRTPTANRLEVEGNASKTAAGGWLANSDRRIKTDIKDIDNAVDVINKLHPVKFHYTEEYREKHSSIEDKYYYNFIAQEFQKVFPDSVQDNGEGFLQIDTYVIGPYLVSAMQEISKQVEELKTENEILEKKIEALERKLK